MEFGRINFPPELWRIYENYVADIGNDFLEGEDDAKSRARARFNNYKKSAILAAPFVVKYDSHIFEHSHIVY